MTYGKNQSCLTAEILSSYCPLVLTSTQLSPSQRVVQDVLLSLCQGPAALYTLLTWKRSSAPEMRTQPAKAFLAPLALYLLPRLGSERKERLVTQHTTQGFPSVPL